jgi:dUTP pyrophosphatase
MALLKIKRLSDSAIMPTYATDGSACFDLYADHAAVVAIGTSPKIKTSLAFEVPENHVMLIFSRSGDGFSKCVRLANCVGVIDSDYRGEVMVKLVSDEGVKDVSYGDRIAQAMLIPLPHVDFFEVKELSSSERGECGFGSTGR